MNEMTVFGLTTYDPTLFWSLMTLPYCPLALKVCKLQYVQLFRKLQFQMNLIIPFRIQSIKNCSNTIRWNDANAK
jgi:hypothetical protein